MLAFQAEIDAFKQALPRLIQEHHEGAFVVLKSGSVAHVSPTYDEALSWAYREYEFDERFFVKQVLEAPEHLTHFPSNSVAAECGNTRRSRFSPLAL